MYREAVQSRFYSATFPAAMVHTVGLSSGALSMQERWWKVSWENV
jgi:hypothetical protein